MTIFTEIIEGKRPGFIIFEDEKHVAILDKYPIDTGHSLVIPKKPYEKITDMPKDEVAELFSKCLIFDDSLILLLLFEKIFKCCSHCIIFFLTRFMKVWLFYNASCYIS